MKWVSIWTYIKLGFNIYCRKVNAQSTIAKRYLDDIFKPEKASFVESPDAHFIFNVSASQKFGAYASNIHKKPISLSCSSVICNSFILLFTEWTVATSFVSTVRQLLQGEQNHLRHGSLCTACETKYIQKGKNLFNNIRFEWSSFIIKREASLRH